MKTRTSFFIAAFRCLLIGSIHGAEKEFQLISGDAKFSYVNEGKTLEIECGPEVVIEWKTFQLDEGEKIHFMQAGENSVVINRLKSGNIAGTLDANGKIRFDLENEMSFSATAQIDCAEFEVLGKQDSASFISNQGEIHAHKGGVFFLADRISHQKTGILEASLEKPIDLIAFSDLKVQGALFAEKGMICLLGPEILLDDQAVLNVSSALGSGKIFIGKDPESLYGHAKSVVLGEGSKIYADSLASGNGGDVLIWGEDKTLFSGFLSAQALGQTGRGGNVEISSRGAYGFKGKVSLSAAHGECGNLLLDPQYVFITPGGGDPATGNTFAANPADTVFIDGAALGVALDAANVIIQANTDISFSDIVSTSTPGNSLTLQAGRSVTFDFFASLTLTGGSLVVVINDSGAIPADRDAGSAQFNFSPYAQVMTQGGDISVNVSSFGGLQIGELSLSQGTLDAGGGNISLTGFGTSDLTGTGVNVSDCTIQTVLGGDISINGTGGLGNGSQNGVVFNGYVGCNIVVEDGNIIVTGQGGNGTGAFNTGIQVNESNISASGAGSVIFNGTGGLGTNYAYGFYSTGYVSTVSVNTGNLTITGTANGSGNFNFGVGLQGETFASNGTGTITVQGNSPVNANSSFGIFMTGANTLVTSVQGAITLTGTGTGGTTSVQGVHMESGALITSTATGGSSGAITLNGTSHGTGNNDNGVSITGFGTSVTSIDGNIFINGNGSGTGPINQGVRIQYPSNIHASGSGTVTIHGTP